MELASERSSDEGGLKEEKGSDYSAGDDDDVHVGHKQEIIVKEPNVANTERSMLEAGPSASPNKKEEVDDLLETTKAEMGVVREENQQLKMNLNKIMNEYRTLEMQFQDILKQGTKNKADKGSDNPQGILEESDLVSLSLGRVPSFPKTDEKTKVSKPLKERFNEELTLGLDCKFETSKSESTNEVLANVSPENSSEVPKEEGGETWAPSKAPKTMRKSEDDVDVAEQNPAKKPRVCVRARCETPTMNDGCQWRKYGQKIAKGNPCPRAYYRCTIAPSCPVRKQVQRCAQDMSILITTYEGTHNHNLPPSATAMASTTSAAASMLLTGSSTSNSSSIPSSTTNNLHGLNFHLSDNSKPRQIYLSNPALSSSASHPTITLDLTSHTPSHPFVRFNQPKYPSSSSLSFSTSSTQQPYNINNILSSSSVNFGRQQMENFYQSYMQKNNNNNNYSNLPQSDTISAATKVITADPTFQSALAAALTSFIGGGGNPRGNQSASSFMNNTPAKKSFMFVPPSSSLPFSAPKSASSSPADNCDTTTT